MELDVVVFGLLTAFFAGSAGLVAGIIVSASLSTHKGRH